MHKTRLVAACCHVKDASKGDERVEKNRRMILECLDRAKALRPDFVVFSEIALQFEAAPTTEAMKHAEPIPGPSTKIVGEKARELGSYVWLPMFENLGGKMHNSVALIDRGGEVAGVYRKYHPTGYEIEDGVHPGEEEPVWETDRGRVGCAVCFDLKYPEVGLGLSRGKAQVVFWPSMFKGGQRVVAWAMDYGFYIVTCEASEGQIVDPCGNVIARSGPRIELTEMPATLTWVVEEVNTDRKTYHLDFNQEKLPAVIEKYGAGVSVQYCTPEGTFSLASNLEELSVEDIEKEFQLEDLRDYLDRADRLRQSRLEGDQA